MSSLEKESGGVRVFLNLIGVMHKIKGKKRAFRGAVTPIAVLPALPGQAGEYFLLLLSKNAKWMRETFAEREGFHTPTFSQVADYTPDNCGFRLKTNAIPV